MKLVQAAVALVYMLFLGYMSVVPLHKPGEHVSMAKQVFDNALHIPAYAVLTYLLIRCFKNVSVKVLITAGLTALGYGILMEYFQSLTPNRYPSFMDVCLNGAGILIAVILRSAATKDRQVI